ncbi:hypothetical protein Mal48_24030 [Thalassoglobus polymorphus]|uniref:Uncharacterized protein n=1 Tax=Thalassoglobus polymorphus TaxID=2527994 RepID=A0A517QND5_9PLAN|nr:hypothetical protein Mal48_24030 [Thalassoglobus polymorphus]
MARLRDRQFKWKRLLHLELESDWEVVVWPLSSKVFRLVLNSDFETTLRFSSKYNLIHHTELSSKEIECAGRFAHCY